MFDITEHVSGYGQETYGRRAVGSLFHSRDAVERAVAELRASGFLCREIGVAMRHWKLAGDPAGNGVHADAHCPGVDSTSLDGIPALLTGSATLSIPGRGTVATGGPLAGAFCSASPVAAATIAGTLARLGVPQFEAENLARGFDAGDILVVVSSDARLATAAGILSNSGYREFESRTTPPSIV